LQALNDLPSQRSPNAVSTVKWTKKIVEHFLLPTAFCCLKLDGVK